MRIALARDDGKKKRDKNLILPKRKRCCSDMKICSQKNPYSYSILWKHDVFKFLYNITYTNILYHITIIHPLQTFFHQQTKEKETNNTATAARVPLTQPKMIQAILRPYQLEGLEFMVKMHELNLTMILGDEMGLVRMTRDGIPMSIAWRSCITIMEAVVAVVN